MIVFDASMGAAGDMIVASLLDLGGDESTLDVVEEVVPVNLDVGRVTKSGQSALKFTVDTDDDLHHRSYTEVVSMVEESDLPDRVVSDAVEVFRLIGEAEARVHDEPLDELHFHEVGADDAVADVLSACLLFDDLGRDVYVGDVRTGGGSVRGAHGVMSVPVPAVTEILAESELRARGGPVDEELLTPTGAALLTYFAEHVDHYPPGSIEDVGYGAGSRDFSEYSNVLKATSMSRGMDTDEVVMLETNLDDVSGEIIGGIYDQLLSEGARDVSVVPLYMKKNRPGFLVKVLCRESDADEVAELLARETGTLGVREIPVNHRFVADRETLRVEIEIGGSSYEVGVKTGSVDGEIFDVSAEYDDAAEVADTAGVPVRRVMEIAVREFSRDVE